MLQDVRKSRGYTQSALAERSGVNVRMIQHFEQGSKNIDHTRISTLCLLARALDCRMADLVNDAALREMLVSTK